MTSAPAFEKLAPRHRDCLRLAHRRLTTKEIARELGLAPGTVATYCKEAMAILGVGDRRDAADLLHAYENAPFTKGPPSEGIGGAASTPPVIVSTGRPAHFLGPLAPANRDADNDQTITARIGWILLLTIGIAIAFGALASGVRTLSDIVRSEQRGPR